MHYDLVFNFFKKSKQASNYNFVKLVNFDLLGEKELIDLTTSKEKQCVLLFAPEPKHYFSHKKLPKQWIIFKNLLKEYKIKNCDFYITQFFAEKQYNEIILDLNQSFDDCRFDTFYIDTPCLFTTTVNESINLKNNDDLFLNECNLKFSHCNFTHRMHRKLFSKFLIKEKLIDNNLIAINNFEERKQLKIEEYQKENIKLLIGMDVKDGWDLNINFLNLFKNVPLSYTKHPDIDDNNFSPHLKFLHKASINIVSESVFHYPYPWFSEKIVQSLLSKRPFILIGSAGSLESLKIKGFRTFEKIIDESYDKIYDPNKRLEKIMEIVLNLNNKSQEELKNMVNDVGNDLLHNYSLMLEKIKHFENKSK